MFQNAPFKSFFENGQFYDSVRPRFANYEPNILANTKAIFKTALARESGVQECLMNKNQG
jgi:hypothetical protein